MGGRGELRRPRRRLPTGEEGGRGRGGAGREEGEGEAEEAGGEEEGRES